MNNTFYNYNDLLDFINDIIRNKKIWTKYGLIHSFSISNILNPAQQGYISLMIRTNNIIQNLNKYTFSLAQFKTIIFSNEVHGIEMYKKTYPSRASQVLAFWENLTPLEKQQYLDLGLNLTDELDKFPTFIFPDILNEVVLHQIGLMQSLNLSETFKLNTGLHKFAINSEILFHVYFDYYKSEYVITNLSSIITNTRDNLFTINVYVEDNILYCQNILEDIIYIKKYSNYT
jgi:hypothetical protein